MTRRSKETWDYIIQIGYTTMLTWVNRGRSMLYRFQCKPVFTDDFHKLLLKL